ncbi:MAG: hypothetical protein QM813_03195 [Verrucomicrobiota bacterium]
MSRPTGFTLLQGEDSEVTFLMTAIAHSQSVVRPRRSIFGVDIHAPDWFVPADDLVYLDAELDESLVQRAVATQLGRLAKSHDALVLINAGVSGFRLLRQIRELAEHNHMVLGIGVTQQPPNLGRLFTVSSCPSSDRIKLHLRG